MDYNKIGNFIAIERKAKKLTQAKLAEKLFVSEKTISKWENGKGIPDTNTLPIICKVFNITINELLNGEKLTAENYQTKAENKLLELQKENSKKDKRLLFAEIIIGAITVVAFLSLYVIGIYALEELNFTIAGIIIICISISILASGSFLCLYIEQKAGFYVCNQCNHKYRPSYVKILFAPHINRTRYMKCPNCKKYSWHKKIIK